MPDGIQEQKLPDNIVDEGIQEQKLPDIQEQKLPDNKLPDIQEQKLPGNIVDEMHEMPGDMHEMQAEMQDEMQDVRPLPAAAPQFAPGRRRPQGEFSSATRRPLVNKVAPFSKEKAHEWEINPPPVCPRDGGRSRSDRRGQR